MARLRTVGGVALAVLTRQALAAATDVAGGSAASPTDITAHLLANRDVNLTGGNYVVTLPASGPGIVAAASVDSRIADMGSTGFSSSTNPAIAYAGVVSGNGTVLVRSGFATAKPVTGQPFTGGTLIFTGTAGQTWGVPGVSSGGHNASALIIDTNASVEFFFPGENDRPVAGAPTAKAFPASTTLSRNITNDGFLFSTTANDWASITGGGISAFAYFGGDRGTLGAVAESRYSGQAFYTANGCKWSGKAVIENRPDGRPTQLVTRGLTVFEPLTSQTLTNVNYKAGDPVKLVPSDMFNWGLNIQLWWNGIHQFTGMFLPTTASKSFLLTAPVSDAVKGVYSYNGAGMAFGRVVNLNNNATLLMGDGRDVVTHPDGVMNNVWLQGNPFNTLLSTDNFVGAPNPDGQALAYAYSGTYRLDHNFNAAVDAEAGVIKGIRNTIWTNLLVLDPTLYNPQAHEPNHPVITAPVFFGGLTRIDSNAVLQLGDGTVGNNVSARTLSFSDGTSATYAYSDSGGNGMLMTKGNDALLPRTGKLANVSAGVKFEIRNNGALVVDNTPGALDATPAGASAGVSAWMTANQLDGITGSGRVEQMGSLPLTLGAAGGNDNTYTGGTLIDANATLRVASLTALGRSVPGSIGTGGVVNRGTLQIAGNLRIIAVPGDYTQR